MFYDPIDTCTCDIQVGEKTRNQFDYLSALSIAIVNSDSGPRYLVKTNANSSDKINANSSIHDI